MNPESQAKSPAEAECVVCPKCLLNNEAGAAFCADCGAPIGMVSTLDPLQQIYAQGFAYRSAVSGPPRLIVLVGIWLLFAPAVVVVPLHWMHDAPGGTGEGIARTLFCLGAAVILARATWNYRVKSRHQAAEAND